MTALGTASYWAPNHRAGEVGENDFNAPRLIDAKKLAPREVEVYEDLAEGGYFMFGVYPERNPLIVGAWRIHEFHTLRDLRNLSMRRIIALI